MTHLRRDLFAILRPAMGGQVPSTLVQKVDALLDKAGVARDAEDAVPKASLGALQASPDAERIVKEFEGCAKKQSDGTFAAYPDPGSGGDPWTIGWGSTGPDIKKGVVWTQKQCDDRFSEHLGQFAARVAKLLAGAPTTQAQFDALVSLAYNIGTGNLSTSTLLKKHKAGDYAGAQREFARWNKAAGKIMAGLTRRRAAEAALYGKRV